MLSIIIPSRRERWLDKTIADLYSKARGEVEVIVVLDGVWQDIADPRVKVIHQGTPGETRGMREAINAGMALASGEWVMKCDGHTMWDEGYDLKLIADCEDDWVVIPRRYRLDVDLWGRTDQVHDENGKLDRRPPVDYMYVEYPFLKAFDGTQGLHGEIWKQPYDERRDVLIDDTPTMQGSAYFMKKSHWDRLINPLDSNSYGPFTHESQEISFKTWFTGGRVVVNKKVWYAHLHKGRKHGTGYGFNTQQWKDWKALHEKGRLFCIDYWLKTKDYKYDMEWFVDKKFPDMPNWGSDWKQRIIEDRKKDYSVTGYKDTEWLEGLRKNNA